MGNTTTSIDYSRVYHVPVGHSIITVQVWSEGPAGFDEPVTDEDITTALPLIAGGIVAESVNCHGKNTAPKADHKHLTTP